jgi:DHA1 family multidrug resistance protein-like MFS transporter
LNKHPLRTTPKLVWLFVVYFFVQGIIHNLGHPVTPALVRSLDIEDFMFGVYFASMSFGLMLGGPLFGRLGDRGHRKVFVTAGLVMYSIGQLIFGLSHDAVLMAVARFISGLGVVSSFTLFTSRMVEETPEDKRTQYLAWIGAATTIGSSIGYYLGGFAATNPVVSTWLGTTDLSMIFVFQSILNALYVLGIVVTYPKETHFIPIAAPVRQGLRRKIEPSLTLFLVALFLMTVGTVNLGRYIDVYFNDLGYTSEELGLFVMTTGFVSLFATFFLIPWFGRQANKIGWIQILQTASAMIVFFVFRAKNFLLAVYTAYMIYILFRTIFPPLEQHVVAGYAAKGRYGSMFGTRQAAVSLGMVVGPLLGGVLYEIAPILVFDVSAATFVVGSLILFLIPTPIAKENPAYERTT